MTEPDLANGFANNGCGLVRISLDQLSAHRAREQAKQTTVAISGRA